MGPEEHLRLCAHRIGVKFNGISAQDIHGRGIGIVAEQTLESDELLLRIPHSVLLTENTVRQSIKDIAIRSVHGMLAAELCQQDSAELQPWRRNLPDVESFRKSFPIMWPSSLQTLLPQASWRLLEKQKTKMRLDWATASAVLPDMSFDQYQYYWMLVNTRTFYWTSPDPSVEIPSDPYDCLAIVPFADYFNHANEGCRVEYSEFGYDAYAHRRIEKGEEIYISYGNHNNDFLLTEYGFVMDDNEYDHVVLDEVLLPRFSTQEKEDLKAADFLGNFVLDKDDVCYRTKIALRRLCLPRKEWNLLVANGLEEPDDQVSTANSLLLESLNEYLQIAEKRLREIVANSGGQTEQRALLRRRWDQIKSLLIGGVNRYTK